MFLIIQWRRLLSKPHLHLIVLLGIIVPLRLRADWRQEWETELTHRESKVVAIVQFAAKNMQRELSEL